jgi:Ca-activated chloride channel family protein
MNVLDNFHFIRPAWLLLAPMVICLWLLQRRSQDPLRGWRAVMDREFLSALIIGDDLGGRWRGTGLLVGGLVAVVALAGPTWRPEPSPFADDPVPVMLVLKAGETMELSDFLPDRMERARLKIRDFAEDRKGQPLGLICYSGSAHLVLPPTRDTSVVATMAAEISPAIMPKPGDDLVAALQLAERTMADAGGRVVVIADTVAQGSENSLAEFRENSRVPVFFLAIVRPGTPEADAIQKAADALNAKVTLMTPDLEDVHSLVRSTARAPVAVSEAAEGTRWEETGYWLVPVLALFSLAGFRRIRNASPEQSLS